MSYINSKNTRIYVNPEWSTEDGAPEDVTTEVLASDGWVFVGGVRNDSAQNTPNTTEFNHYGEPDAVVVRGKPNRSMTLPLSEDLADNGQSIIRWASDNDENIGVLVLKDGTNGYAVLANATYSGESGDAAGGLRAAEASISPIDVRQYVGDAGIFVPEES